MEVELVIFVKVKSRKVGCTMRKQNSDVGLQCATNATLKMELESEQERVNVTNSIKKLTSSRKSKVDHELRNWNKVYPPWNEAERR